MIVNSNHNYAGDVLFQPGFSRADEPGFPKGTIPPYQDKMKALSDKIAAAAHYASFVSYNLYDVTGATEDWNYFAQGAYGYTTEVGYGNFHPNYQDAVIDQYTGSVDGANSIARGATVSKGLRESMLETGEAALDPAQHSTLTGTAPAGRILRLQKTFTTTTSYVLTNPDASNEVKGDAQQIPEHLDSTLTVPSNGSYTWAVDPSTRPLEILAGRTEAWKMTCEDAAGTVYETKQVVVAMGESQREDFACGQTPTGTSGTSGSAGTTGGPGPAGDPGAPGAAGDPGPTGAPGSPGAAGAPGQPGAAGDAGPNGAAGGAGAAGPVGNAGTAGPAGPSTTVTIPAPATVAPNRLVISRPAFSAKRTKRVGSLQVRLRLLGGGTLTGVKITIRDARRRTLFSGSLATLTGSQNVRLKPKVGLSTLKLGAVKVVVTGTSAGNVTTITKASSITR